MAQQQPILPDELLLRMAARAAGYDRENRFFDEDFDELKAAGYLRMALPREFGGLGMNVAEVGRETRKLAMYAPATALALNMRCPPRRRPIASVDSRGSGSRRSLRRRARRAWQ